MGYRSVGDGIYLDVATGERVDFSTVYNDYILPNAYDANEFLAEWRDGYNMQKAYEDKNAIAAASNSVYGKNFGGDDDPIFGEIYTLKGKCISGNFEYFGLQFGFNFAYKSYKSSAKFGLDGVHLDNSVVSAFGISFIVVGLNYEYNYSSRDWSSEYSVGPLITNKSGTYLRGVGGELGLGAVAGGYLYYNIGNTGPDSTYVVPPLPSDKTNYLNPYKIH